MTFEAFWSAADIELTAMPRTGAAFAAADFTTGFGLFLLVSFLLTESLTVGQGFGQN